MRNTNIVQSDIEALAAKVRHGHWYVRMLLIELAKIPGMVSHDRPDGEDISRSLNEAVKDVDFLERWLTLAMKYQVDGPFQDPSEVTSDPENRGHGIPKAAA